MNFGETVRTALDAIRSRRLRSALTVLGILIGIAAVMLTVGLGQGAQQKVTEQINSLGSNLLVVTPGSTTSTTGVRGGFGSASSLTSADASLLADAKVAPDIAAVAPVSTGQQEVDAGAQNWTTSVVGTTPAWEQVRARTTSQGRFFSTQELDSAARVAVIGSTTASELFGVRNPVGQTVTVAGVPFTIIGMLNTAGSTIGGDQDDQLVVPATTWAAAFSSSGGASVSSIYLQAASQDTLSAAYQEASNALMTSHGQSAATADFTVNSQASLVQTATATTSILTVLLAGIAAISLLVGGIGVMNIMLVSVTERVREIGLRKALGATPRAIQRQFLVEASMLGLVGGVMGVLVGVVFALILTPVIGFPVAISIPAALGALVVSLGIGVVAGVYPARRAARLAPIDALRSE
ncbi:ABC transporter permease [Microbacterium rhizosphaerae]|uniref:ABC transporter permease n=1 Tax=Microbacterium rhizosphaerae TaxID=1678237 RepID=A0ABZ0SL91_9MICO|nr:ABC transporter permease [Microbacterium rhizosphaerae]WPR89265.1 ABC transporter permease [Microbacterium rhizosphaerae]